MVETQLTLLELGASSGCGNSTKGLFMIRPVVKHPLRQAYEFCNPCFPAPGSAFEGKNGSFKAALYVQTRTCRNQPAAADRQFLPSHPQGECPVPTEFFSPLEECLMQVHRVFVHWPRRIQFSIDKAALKLSVKAKTLV